MGNAATWLGTFPRTSGTDVATTAIGITCVYAIPRTRTTSRSFADGIRGGSGTVASSIVWDAISGIAPIHGDPHWCGLVDCKHKSITETAKNGLEVGKWWRENGVRLGMAPTHTRKAPYKPILDAERAMWTPKTILARQKLGLGGGIVESPTDDVPF
jgi:hypothetical protein